MNNQLNKVVGRIIAAHLAALLIAALLAAKGVDAVSSLVVFVSITLCLTLIWIGAAIGSKQAK